MLKRGDPAVEIGGKIKARRLAEEAFSVEIPLQPFMDSRYFLWFVDLEGMKLRVSAETYEIESSVRRMLDSMKRSTRGEQPD